MSGYRRVLVDKRTLPRTPEVKAKIAAALKGRRVPPDVLEKRVASQTGLKRSPEFVARLRERMRGKGFPRKGIERSASVRRGKKLTPEHRAALVAAANRYPPVVKQAQRMVNKLKKAINEKQD